MSYSYKGRNILGNILASPSGTDTNNNSLGSNYKINGEIIKVLKPFCTSSDYDLPRFYSPAPDLFGGLSSDTNFCPAYTIHTSSATNISINSDVTAMFVICIGGGGGGGGGGSRVNPGNVGGSGQGGGGGAFNAWFITRNPSYTTYDITIGAGGTYGQPTSNTAVAEGAESTTGTNVEGKNGGPGGNTICTYATVSYTSPGGIGGTGGVGDAGQTQANTGGGAGGGIGSPTPFLHRVGDTGTLGVFDNVTLNNAGGNGGSSGNRRTGTRFVISNDLIDVGLVKNKSTGETDANYCALQKYRGDGGRGGRSEGAAYGWAGYSGHPGCAIVFFYYHTVVTTAPIITTVTNSGTFTFNNASKSFHIIAIGGGGGGGGGVYKDSATSGGGGGGGASGTFFVGYSNSVPTNKTLTITIGVGGALETINGSSGGGWHYPANNHTAGGDTIITGTNISITVYGGKKPQSLSTIAQPANGPGAGISDNFPAYSGVTQIYSSKGVAGPDTTGGGARTVTGWYGDGASNALFNTEYLNSSNGSVMDGIDISTFGNGGRGGWGESSRATFDTTTYNGAVGQKGVVFIIEY